MNNKMMKSIKRNAKEELIIDLINKVNENPDSRSSFIEDIMPILEDMGYEIRICDECGKVIIDGYYLAGYYACSEKCACALTDCDNEEELYELCSDDSDEFYWTEWMD